MGNKPSERDDRQGGLGAGGPQGGAIGSADNGRQSSGDGSEAGGVGTGALGQGGQRHTGGSSRDPGSQR